jgi:hypothetical protein
LEIGKSKGNNHQEFDETYDILPLLIEWVDEADLVVVVQVPRR